MPRMPRNNMKASFFHIMVQGIKKEYIFDNKENMEKYVKLLNDKKEEILILAYCIMGNHAHILAKVNDINSLEGWMHKVNTSYARYYNKKNDRVGYVFRDRYKSQQIIDGKYLYNCIQYIHNNPVKADICKRQEDYEYSSFKQIYKGKNENVIKLLNSVMEFGYLNYKDLVNEPLMAFLEENQDKEDICNVILKQFEWKYNIQLKDLRKNKSILEQLVKTLKLDFGISYRTIEKVIGISRRTFSKLLKDSDL